LTREDAERLILEARVKAGWISADDLLPATDDDGDSAADEDDEDDEDGDADGADEDSDAAEGIEESGDEERHHDAEHTEDGQPI
jgi:hypothetical protein